MDQYISRPDTDRFGVKVARINSFPAPVPSIIDRCRAAGFRLIISRVPAEDIGLINELEHGGFRIKDIQVTHSFDLKLPVPEKTSGPYSCREFQAGDVEAIAAIAFKSFSSYGHYSRLDRFKPVNTGIIYRDWARRCCLSPGVARRVIVAEKNSEIAAFLALTILEDPETRYASAVMGAVNDRHRGKGVYRNLNIEALNWAEALGLDRMEQNVLLENYPAHKTFTGLGFAITRSRVTMHCLL